MVCVRKKQLKAKFNIKSPFHIILLFSKNTTLDIWGNNGTLSREIAIYKMFINEGHDVTMVTFGSSNDLNYLPELCRIRLICNKWNLSNKLYLFYLTKIFPLFLRRKSKSVIITQQINSIDIALKIGRLAKIPVIARCGYMLSLFNKYQYGKNSIQYKKAVKIEKHGFESSDEIFVTADYMKDYILKKYNVQYEKVFVVPNYVITEQFRLSKNFKIGCSLIYVGSIKYQKNIFALIEANRLFPIKLKIVCGYGNDRYNGEIQKKIKDYALDVTLNKDIIGHDQLPSILNNSSIFILPSLYEGHPKALIEAMACGLPVIATDVQGINNIIDHSINGYLCGTSPEEISEAIKTVAEDISLQKTMAENARKFVVENFSLDIVYMKEKEYIERILANYKNIGII